VGGLGGEPGGESLVLVDPELAGERDAGEAVVLQEDDLR
jgi:hypothetical protein